MTTTAATTSTAKFTAKQYPQERKRLTARARKAFRALHSDEGLTWREIAELTGGNHETLRRCATLNCMLQDSAHNRRVVEMAERLLDKPRPAPIPAPPKVLPLPVPEQTASATVYWAEQVTLSQAVMVSGLIVAGSAALFGLIRILLS